MVYRSGTGHRANVEEYTNVGLEDGSESIEKPAMGVDFLLVLFFEAENELNRDYTLFCALNFHRGRDRDCNVSEYSEYSMNRCSL